MLVGFLLLISTIGCSHTRHSSTEGLAERILPPVDLDTSDPIPTPKKLTPDAPGKSQAHLGQPTIADDADFNDANLLTPASGNAILREPVQTLTLPEAIDRAFRQQPR